MEEIVENRLHTSRTGLREKMAALPHDAARTSADVVRLLLASGRGYRLESGEDIPAY